MAEFDQKTAKQITGTTAVNIFSFGIATGLDVDKIDFKEQVNGGSIIRYSFNGLIDISAVKKGMFAQISASTNKNNDGTFPIAFVNDDKEAEATIVAFGSLGGDTLIIDGTNITNTTLTEGVDWTAATDNATTATSLRDAVNTISGVSAAIEGDVVIVTADAGAFITTFTSSDTTNMPVHTDWIHIQNPRRANNVEDEAIGSPSVVSVKPTRSIVINQINVVNNKAGVVGYEVFQDNDGAVYDVVSRFKNVGVLAQDTFEQFNTKISSSNANMTIGAKVKTTGDDVTIAMWISFMN